MKYTIKENEQFKSLEVEFDEKPDQGIIKGLKALGFKWHKIKKIWYGYTTKEELEKRLQPQETAKNEETDSKIKLESLTMVQDFEERYELLKNFYNKNHLEKMRYSDKKNDVDYFNKCLMENNTFFKTADGLNFYIRNSKPAIQNQLWFDDETDGPDNTYENFELYNLKYLNYYGDKKYKYLFKNNNMVDMVDLACSFYHYEETDFIRALTQEEQNDIDKIFQKQVDDFKKRLKNYWKKYQSKIHWSGYWVNR